MKGIEETIFCPLCEKETMKFIGNEVWVCGECPGVLFEFFTKEDALNSLSPILDEK